MGVIVFLEDEFGLIEKYVKNDIDVVRLRESFISTNIVGPRLFEFAHINNIMDIGVATHCFVETHLPITKESFLNNYICPEVISEKAFNPTVYDTSLVSDKNVVLKTDVVSEKTAHYTLPSRRDAYNKNNLGDTSVLNSCVCITNIGCALKENYVRNSHNISNQKLIVNNVFASACILEKEFSNNFTAIQLEQFVNNSKQSIILNKQTIQNIYDAACNNQKTLQTPIAKLFDFYLSPKYPKGYFSEKCLRNVINANHLLCNKTVQLNYLDNNAVMLEGLTTYSVMDETSCTFIQNTLIIKTASGELLTEFLSVSLETDINSYCWTLVLNTVSPVLYSKCKVFSSLLVSFDGFPESTFIIDDRRMTKTANADGTIGIGYTITGRSKTSLLGDWSASINSTWANIQSHDILKQIALDTGVTIDYSDMPNWKLPLMSVDGLLPVEIIKKLTDACGCFMSTIADTLYIKKKYNVAPVLWNTEYVPYSRDICSLDTCLSITDYIEIGENYTEVIVSDYQDSASFNINLELLELISETDALVTLTSQPVLSATVAQEITKTSHLPDGVFVSYLGEFFTEVSETVEVINGTVNTSQKAYSITAWDYKRNTDLGLLTINENNEIKTEIAGTSLVTITYLAHTHRFQVTSNDTKVQLYTET